MDALAPAELDSAAQRTESAKFASGRCGQDAIPQKIPALFVGSGRGFGGWTGGMCQLSGCISGVRIQASVSSND